MFISEEAITKHPASQYSSIKTGTILLQMMNLSSVLFAIFLQLFCRISGADARTGSTLSGGVVGEEPRVPAFIVFGDSIADAGNNNKLPTLVKCNFPPYGQDYLQQTPTGRFSNGRIPPDFMAEALGVKKAVPAYLDPNLTPEDLLTGVSFASGGAGYDNLTSRFASVLTLWDQIDLFEEYIEKLKVIGGEERAAAIVSESVYMTLIGSDDIANTYFGTPLRRKQYDVSSYADLLANSAYDFYQRLYDLGVRKILAVGLPPIGCVPSQRTLGGGITRDCAETQNQAAKMVNSKLVEKIEMLAAKNSDLKIVYVNIYDNLYDIIQRPFNHGFEVSNIGCCGTGMLEVSILCNPSTRACEDPSKFVFWDSYHPTEVGYRAIVDPVIKYDLPRVV